MQNMHKNMQLKMRKIGYKTIKLKEKQQNSHLLVNF